ncbi:MAG: hypothetical protein ACHREM_08750 [Polyangiales bacterium]
MSRSTFIQRTVVIKPGLSLPESLDAANDIVAMILDGAGASITCDDLWTITARTKRAWHRLRVLCGMYAIKRISLHDPQRRRQTSYVAVLARRSDGSLPSDGGFPSLCSMSIDCDDVVEHGIDNVTGQKLVRGALFRGNLGEFIAARRRVYARTQAPWGGPAAFSLESRAA